MPWFFFFFLALFLFELADSYKNKFNLPIQPFPTFDEDEWKRHEMHFLGPLSQVT